ncbi:MAG: hypothetical protein P8J64_06740 [Dehalococcoidia bacterium]|nr:hypothetical protein [Dehalococcoidia bacterium]
MTDQSQPENLDFLRGYWETTLWKPQVVADNVLTGIYLADASYRAALATLMLQECAEAARRLSAVFLSLQNSPSNVSAVLKQNLPTASDWEDMINIVEAQASPAELLQTLGLENGPLKTAEEFLNTRSLLRYAVPISLYEQGPPIVTNNKTGANESMLELYNSDLSGNPVTATIPLEEEQVVALGDATGDFVTWARDFLGTYIDRKESQIANESEL